MKILEQAKKKTESIRFDDGVGAGIPTLSERGEREGGGGEASDSTLLGLRGGEMAFKKNSTQCGAMIPRAAIA